ncbi:MAG: PQQ-like beta-propeller repeat protein [Verrucomicrobiae bacterium]|nr:PQQ-like beta-propeller repeat protein [Verrucomicrobiae bacterium]
MKPRLPRHTFVSALADRLRLARLVFLAALVAGLQSKAHGADRWDWTQRLPTVAWRAEVGAGFASVATHDGLVIAFGNVADEDWISALDAASGQLRWRYRYPCRAMGIAKPDEAGPRVTPCVQAGMVYTMSRDGRLLCLEAATGALRWWRDVPAEIGEKPPYWGFSGSPLPWDGLLIWSVGDHGLAVRAATGETAWKSPPRPSTVWKNEPVGTSGYTTPQPVTFNGRKLVSLANENQWVIVDPADGKVVWSTPWKVPYGVTSTQPLLIGNRVLLSGGYGFGVQLVELGKSNPVWYNKNLRCHFSNLAVVGEHVYGIHGNQQDGPRCELRCLRLRDGEVVWAREGFGFGNLTLVDERLLVLTAKGELLMVVPSPEGYREAGRVQILSGDCWTAPLVAGDCVYARNKQGLLVRVNLP